jgi:hypothetical protein
MKKISVIFLFGLLLGLTAKSQRNNKFASLDRYFAGIPLQSTFDQWYDYVAGNPHLGIDSSNRRGNHSSFKPGIESYFPFPDSLKVKIVFQKIIFADARTRQFVDSFKTIAIEGLFGAGKPARKESNKFFKGLRRELMRDYRYEYRDYYEPASWFYQGKSSNFPNCSLHHGYSNRLKSYFVLLAYSDEKSQLIKSYPPPDNTLRN